MALFWKFWSAGSSWRLCRSLSVASQISAEHQGRSSWSGYLLFLPPMFAAGLGVWQIQRKQWKEDLLEARQSRVFSAPTSLFDHLTDLQLYDRIYATGTFLEGQATFVGPRPRTINGTQQKGYVLIMPLLDPQSHQVVLVNRGWVPESWRTAAESAASGEQDRNQPWVKDQTAKVDGLITESEAPSVFVPKNDPTKQQWFWIDSKAIAKSCNLPPETRLIQVIQQSDQKKPIPQIHGGRGRTIEFNAAEEYPVVKDLSDFVNFTVMPIDHLNYAVIWFSLAAATSAMAFRVLRKRKR